MKPILANKLVNALSNPKRGLAGYSGGSIAESMAKQTQVEIVKANKFVIDNTLVSHAVEASFSKPSVLLDMLENAKPPYNNLWIEWDESFRQECLKTQFQKERANCSEVNTAPEKVGYHINLLEDDLGDKYFIYTAYSQLYEPDQLPPSKQGQFISAPMSMILYNNDYPSFEDTKAKNDLLGEVPDEWVVNSEDALFFEKYKNTCRLMGAWYSFKNTPKGLIPMNKNGEYVLDVNNIKKLINHNKSHEFNCFKEIANRIEMGQSASMHWLISKDQFQSGYEREEMEFYLKQSLESLSGDARFLISLFGLLNSDITTTEHIIPDEKLIHTQFGKRVPRNSYKTLSVNLNKTQVRKVYKSKYTGIKKRQHERRGHWRNYTNGKKIWIDSYLAGDPNLGFVNKDYNFKKEE